MTFTSQTFKAEALQWVFKKFVYRGIQTEDRRAPRSANASRRSLPRNELAQYENAIQTAFRDVSDALVQFCNAENTLAYMRYRGGVHTMLNALNSDQDLFVAELSLAHDPPVSAEISAFCRWLGILLRHDPS